MRYRYGGLHARAACAVGVADKRGKNEFSAITRYLWFVYRPRGNRKRVRSMARSTGLDKLLIYCLLCVTTMALAVILHTRTAI